jgi:hypothetical protein
MKRDNLISVFICFIAITAVFPLGAKASGYYGQERIFIWDEANAKMLTARTREQFLDAATSYRKLANAGVSNGALFYNLGTALLMAGELDEGREYLLRAERYMGSNWDIERNMLICAAGKDKNETISLPWYRFFLFWHYGLPVTTRMNIAVYSFAGIWLLLILRRLGFRKITPPLLTMLLIALILFGSSTATTIHQEAKLNQTISITDYPQDLTDKQPGDK